MKELAELTGVRRGEPDDLFLACSGFEDRCLALLTYGERYHARTAALIRFIPARPQKALDHKKATNTATLSDFLRLRSDRFVELTSSRYNPLELELSIEDEIGEVVENARTITIDISCFTRIQLLYALRILLAKPGRIVRMIYTTPAFYASADKRDITLGADGLLFMPYLTYGGKSLGLSPDNFLVAGLGHEGARCLLAWRALEPKRTILILPENRRSPDVTRWTRQQNEQLLERVTAGDPTFSLRRVEPLDIAGSVRQLMHVFDDLDLRDPDALIALMPGGPKPVVASFAIATLSLSVSCYVAYPLVSGYDPAYSTGIGKVFQHIVRTPIRMTHQQKTSESVERL